MSLGALGAEIVITGPWANALVAVIALLIGGGLLALAYWVLPRPVASYVAGLGGFILLALVIVLWSESDVVLGASIVAAVIAAVAWYVRRYRRSAAAGGFARANGLAFASRDRGRVTGWDFDLFRAGSGRRAANVVSGTWRGAGVTAADFRWWVTKGHVFLIPLRRSRRHSIVVIDAPVSMPRASAVREERARLLDKVLTRDVDFELETFNRAFVTKARDREFAYALFDQRMMQWLLDRTAIDGIEVDGSRALVFCRRLPAAQLPWLLDAARDFLDRIPRVVRTRYGGDVDRTVSREGT